MILNSIRLKNFRQFYGEQELQFSKDRQNTTIILGNNGTGKTGIFRALIFSLFGEVHLEQDNEDDRIQIVNFKAMNENSGAPTEAWVSVEFEDNNIKFNLKRYLKAVSHNDTVDEREEKVELYITDERGNFPAEPITDRREINHKIESIIDKDIKDFFFFDGEQINTLAKTDQEVKQEVKNGIIKILKIDEIGRMIEILNDLSRSEQSRITREANNKKLSSKKQEIEKLETNNSELEVLNSEHTANTIVLKNKIKLHEEKLKENEEISELQKEKELILSARNGQQQLVSRSHGEIRDILFSKSKSAGLLLTDAFNDMNNYLTGVRSSQKDKVDIALIKQTIENKKCILCGNDLERNHSNLQHVQQLEKNYQRGELTGLISWVQSYMTDYQDDDLLSKTTMQEALIDIKSHKEQLELTDTNLEHINREIKEKANTETNLTKIQQELESHQGDLNKLNIIIATNQKSISDNENKLKIANKEFAELAKRNETINLEWKAIEFINGLEGKLESIFKDYSNSMRHRLSREATKIFKTLISEKSKGILNKININEKYEIEVIGWEDQTLTTDISQGERQLVSLSFITALSKVATSYSNSTNFPLFMDTPFGRLDVEHRENLINNISELTSQWILLLTDSEFANKEGQTFRNVNRIGNVYILDKIENGYSKIVSSNLKEVLGG